MIAHAFAPRFLGPVPLVRRPALGANPAATWRNYTAPEDAKPPAGKTGCFFLGGRSFLSGQAIDQRIGEAKAAGYADIHELDVPPCVEKPGSPFPMCLVSSNTPSKYVWACPSPGAAVPPPRGAQPAPAGPSAAVPPEPAPFPVVPVVGGVAAAGLVAALLLR